MLAPTLTIFHELGHATIPLFNGKETSIQVGSNRFISLRVGKLKIEIGLLKPWIGFSKWESAVSSWAFAGGPLVSLILGLVFMILGYRVSDGLTSSLFLACAGWCLLQFVFTAIPLNYPQWLGFEPGAKSDGRQLLEIFKNSSAN